MKLRSLFAAVSGNFIEWYDFALYLFLAPVLAKAFFPAAAGRLALLGALTVHTISFFFRPLGAIVFGHLGDVRGRRVALQISLSVLSFLSIVIALLPTYAKIGWLAPLLLCLCRIGQGICLGGEFAGSMIYLSESVHPSKRSLWSSMSNNGSNFGILMASCSAAFLSMWLEPAHFESYGYRLLFLSGGLVGVIGFALRSDLHETVAFKTRSKQLTLPLAHILSFEKKRLAQLFLLLSVSAVGSYGFMGSISTFLQQTLAFSLPLSLCYETVFILFSLALVPLFGWLADKITPQKMLKRACVAYILISMPSLYGYFQFQQPLFLVPILIIYCMEQASSPAFMCALFPVELRYTAVSIAYNLSMAIVGGLSPLFTQTSLGGKGQSYSMAYLLMASSLIALPLITVLMHASNRGADSKGLSKENFGYEV